MNKDGLALLVAIGVFILAAINTRNNAEALDVAKETQQIMKEDHPHA